MVFFAVQLWGVNLEQLREMVKIIEDSGYDAVYYGDGPFDWILDCYCTLSLFSSITQRIRIGPAVTYLDNRYRSLVAVAKSLATLDQISKGRLDIRIGFIKEEARNFWKDYGIDLPKLNKRIKIYDEGIKCLKCLLRGEKFEGRIFKVNKKIVPEPIQKPHPPICVSAMGKITGKIAYKHADILEISYVSPEIASKYVEMLPKIDFSIEIDVIIAKNSDDFIEKRRSYFKLRKIDENNEIYKSAIKGEPNQCIKQIEKYLNLGIKRFTLSFNEIPDISGIELFSREVLPCFKN